jgi:hypothetical protein
MLVLLTPGAAEEVDVPLGVADADRVATAARSNTKPKMNHGLFMLQLLG